MFLLGLKFDTVLNVVSKFHDPEGHETIWKPNVWLKKKHMGIKAENGVDYFGFKKFSLNSSDMLSLMTFFVRHADLDMAAWKTAIETLEFCCLWQ